LVFTIYTQFFGEALSTATAAKQVEKLVRDVLVTMTYQAQLQQTVEKSIDGTLTAKAPTATPTPAPTNTRTPYHSLTRLSPKDGMELVFIPTGDFIMGSSDTEVNTFSDERPEHRVYLDAYWIDKTQVTNALYALCGQCWCLFIYRQPRCQTKIQKPRLCQSPGSICHLGGCWYLLRLGRWAIAHRG
jgi:formylglycine-generating enzyme required for sulfatase activity